MSYIYLVTIIKTRFILLLLTIFLVVFSHSKSVHAQAEDEVSDDIEALFNQEAKRNESDRRKKESSRTQDKASQEKIKDLGGLVRLAPFNDVAIIQKRFLPKTGRFEFFGGGSTNLNDAFFFNIGLVGRAGYYITEKWSLEGILMYLGTEKRSVTEDLKVQKGVLTDSLITPEMFYGVDVKWSPIYGKYSFLDEKIIPFDLYFSAGLGITETNQEGQSPMTIHLGTGQIFAISKSFALRWDFSWNFYTTKSSVSGKDELTDNLFITIGASFFFPEAKYR